MSALATNNAGLSVREGSQRVNVAYTGQTIYNGSFVRKDSTYGKLYPLSTAAGVFAGIAMGINPPAALGGDGEIALSRSGQIKLGLSGVTYTDIDKPVYCSTDNPADATLTFTTGAKQIGTVGSLVFDGSGLVANYAWVSYDVDKQEGAALIERMASLRALAVTGTTETEVYRCPTGKRAVLLSADVETDAQLAHTTSAVLTVSKVSGTIRTTALSTATVDVNATALTVDTVTALTIATAGVTLAAGERLMASITSVGTNTVGSLKVCAKLAESPA